MKTKTLSLSTILGFFGLLLVIHTMSSHAATMNDKIICETAFGEKSFTIDNDKIAFSKDDETGVSRSISSIDSESIRTQRKSSGFTKTLYLNGNKHKINVENTNQFSEANDFLSITSPKGHEMTYPLNCHSV
jgi:hypothetical protein